MSVFNKNFSVNPAPVQSKRSVFSSSPVNMTSFNFGEIIPIYIKEILPGDTLNMTTQMMFRMSTPLTPVFQFAYLDVYYFWVPNRLCWKHWQEFCGERKDNLSWDISTDYPTLPKLKVMAYQYCELEVSSTPLVSYFGCPTMNVDEDSMRSYEVSSLPFAAYSLIYNEWFRDENVAPWDSTYDTYFNLGSETSDLILNEPYKGFKLHDYFTSCIPAPQKGPAATLSLAGSAPVVAGDIHSIPAVAPSLSKLDGSELSASYHLSAAGGQSYANKLMASSSDKSIGDLGNVAFNNLWTDLSTSSSVTIEQLRTSVTIQRYLETNARYGTRYFEYIFGHYGVTIPNSIVQRPELLAAKRFTLSINQVLNTADNASNNSPLGTTGAFSQTFGVDESFTKTFLEHGFVIGVALARPQLSYYQGIPRYLSRSSLYDFYDPIFANLGAMGVKNKELYFDYHSDNKNEQIFGYQEAWADYRYSSSILTGKMRPNVAGGLSTWTYAETFGSLPTLSKSFLEQGLSGVDQTLAVQSDNAPQLFGQFCFVEKIARSMPVYSIPGLGGVL